MHIPNPIRVLSVDTSPRQSDSVSRRLSERLLDNLRAQHGNLTITRRDLDKAPLPFVNGDWITANFTAPEQRSAWQQKALAVSDRLVQELMDNDLLLIGVPLYNFGIPAALKAWVDMVARARLTFRYTDSGPEGLLKNKRAYLLIASGGVKAGSEMDFATQYMRHVLGFLGITDVTVIAADQIMQRGDAALEQALAEIDGLFSPPADSDQRIALQA
ncbi:MAG: NAD(P)H-dependent oxidoreductase [Gammaproteobacteria bacterium]|nr:NAD(P)H-dependent oxidoreductase [Gammaproteobacteria bacterium]MBU2478247.1 NAD(P)H-dependent oxidoreductase [Gammaproteobacteria bacterium]